MKKIFITMTEASPILIPQDEVPINIDPNHTYTSTESPFLIDEIERRIQEKVHNPDFKAVELAAGNGPIANMLAKLGVPKERIFCIDEAKPPKPLVDGIQWKYMDLDKLAVDLLAGEELDPNVESLRHKFDLVTFNYGVNVFRTRKQEVEKVRREAVLNFFAKEGAIIDYTGSTD